MSTKVLIGGLIGGVVAFFAGWLIYGIALMDVMAGFAGTATGVMKDPADMSGMWAIAVGNISIGVLFSYIFSKTNTSSLAGGATLGAIMGVLISLGYDMIMYGTSNIMQLGGVFVDVIAFAAISALAGAAIGWWHGRK